MTPGPTNGTGISPVAKAARVLLLLDRAKAALGGAAKLGDVLGVARRSVNRKLSADRGVTAFELNQAADAVEARGRELLQLADDLRGMAR